MNLKILAERDTHDFSRSSETVTLSVKRTRPVGIKEIERFANFLFLLLGELGFAALGTLGSSSFATKRAGRLYNAPAQE